MCSLVACVVVRAQRLNPTAPTVRCASSRTPLLKLELSEEEEAAKKGGRGGLRNGHRRRGGAGRCGGVGRHDRRPAG
eukprot:COSAG01_NODE_13029_length_1646_cov_2.350356_3_plen_76_part_01